MRISVITPSFNASRFIKDCVQNVATQQIEGLEHIIVDGGSTDGTLEKLDQLLTEHPHLRILYGPDRGQSDALNKGTESAAGSVIGVLNVDDYYQPGAIAAGMKALGTLSGPGLVVGDCKVIDENDNLLFWNKPNQLKIEQLLLGWNYAQFPCNPAAYFYHREVHAISGGYDVEDHFSMDFDFLLKCIRKVEAVYIPEYWGNFRLHPECKTHQDILGPQRVAGIISRHMQELGKWDRWKIRALKARIDFYNYRRTLKQRIS